MVLMNFLKLSFERKMLFPLRNTQLLLSHKICSFSRPPPFLELNLGKIMETNLDLVFCYETRVGQVWLRIKHVEIYWYLQEIFDQRRRLNKGRKLPK